MNPWRLTLAALVLAVAGAALLVGTGQSGEKKVDNRVFELRVYTANPGKMDDLHARFKNHTIKLLEKHGMQLIGFWTDEKEPQTRLIYLVAHKSKDAATASWKAFQADDDWKTAKAKSEEKGPLVKKVDVTWLNPTDYSALK
jgi:hypothetical protein